MQADRRQREEDAEHDPGNRFYHGLGNIREGPFELQNYRITERDRITELQLLAGEGKAAGVSGDSTYPLRYAGRGA